MQFTNFIFGSFELLSIGLIFAGSLAYAIWFGRQSLINIICATYLALLFYLTNPFLAPLAENLTLGLGLFLFLAIILLLFANRIMPASYLEYKYESLPKKILLATAFTVLIVTILTGFIPVAELMNQDLLTSALAENDIYRYVALSLPIILVALN